MADEKVLGSSKPGAMKFTLGHDPPRGVAIDVEPQPVIERTPALLIVLAALAAKWPAVENSRSCCVFKFLESLAVETLYIG